MDGKVLRILKFNDCIINTDVVGFNIALAVSVLRPFFRSRPNNGGVGLMPIVELGVVL